MATEVRITCPNCGWPAKSTTKKQTHFPDFRSFFRKERKAEETGVVIIPSDVKKPPASVGSSLQPSVPVSSGCISASAFDLEPSDGKPQQRRFYGAKTAGTLEQQPTPKPKPKRTCVKYQAYDHNWKYQVVKQSKRVQELPSPLSDRFRYCIRTFYCPVAHQSLEGLESAPWLAEVALHMNDLSSQFRKNFPWRLNIIKHCWRDKLIKARHPVVAGLYTYGRKLQIECTTMPKDMKPWVVEMTLWSRDIVWLSRLTTESLENIANNETVIRYACPLVAKYICCLEKTYLGCADRGHSLTDNLQSLGHHGADRQPTRRPPGILL